MNYKLVYPLTFLCMLHNRVLGAPIISNIFEGLSTDANNEPIEVESNKLSEASESEIIDLRMYGDSLYGQPDFNYTGRLVAELEESENSVNPEELGSYLEGDILVPHTTLFLKSGLSSMASRWPNGEVPFEIADDFDERELGIIAFAIDEYHVKTCIRFKPRFKELDYVSITKGTSGCWSSIGRTGGKQHINLQAPGCIKKPGTVMHEFMHTLGFFHEQNRKERDFYVSIQLQNVQQYAISNFRKEPNSISFGVEYDYGSVMHYSYSAFTKNGQPTILPKRPINITTMGQRDGFSPMDIEKINRMYNCDVDKKLVPPPVKLQKRSPSWFSFSQFWKNPFFKR